VEGKGSVTGHGIVGKYYENKREKLHFKLGYILEVNNKLVCTRLYFKLLLLYHRN